MENQHLAQLPIHLTRSLCHLYFYRAPIHGRSTPLIQVPLLCQTALMATTTTKTPLLVKPSRVSFAKFTTTVLLRVNSAIGYADEEVVVLVDNTRACA
ncbi:hypothetical protein QYF36_011935 [Acer negundo]|nr:hypothetical protein QYF36_011935 [Acer negundo]